jgi:hypothetical protein
VIFVLFTKICESVSEKREKERKVGKFESELFFSRDDNFGLNL